MLSDTVIANRARVAAVNAIGESLSEPSSTITLMPAVPDPPGAVHTSPGDQFIRVNFTAPEHTGGVPLTSFRVVVWPAVPSFARVHDNHVQSVRAVTGQTVYRTNVSGLVNGVKYRVSVQASNDFHGSFPRFGHDVVPCGPPFQPTHLQTHVGRTQVQFSWEWDTRDGNGRDAQLFNVEYTCGDQHAEWTTHTTSPQSGVVMSDLFQVPGGVSYVHMLVVWPAPLACTCSLMYHVPLVLQM